ncbi:MAG: hypothetical protein WD810_10150 [Solirubrobacterales bacterium]
MARKTAKGDEAAAVAAAIARFEAEVGAPGEAPAVNPWQRAALVEGVGAKETIQDSQGGARWLS